MTIAKVKVAETLLMDAVILHRFNLDKFPSLNKEERALILDRVLETLEAMAFPLQELDDSLRELKQDLVFNKVTISYQKETIQYFRTALRQLKKLYSIDKVIPISEIEHILANRP